MVIGSTYSFAKTPFSAANAPLAKARTIQGEVVDFCAGREAIADVL